jgi:hypothetical protein
LAEVPQRADDAVHGRRGDAWLLLLDLELPDIVGARGVGRAPEPGGEPSEVAQIITLRSFEKRRLVMSSISRWRSGLIGPIWISSFIVRLLR